MILRYLTFIVGLSSNFLQFHRRPYHTNDPRFSSRNCHHQERRGRDRQNRRNVILFFLLLRTPIFPSRRLLFLFFPDVSVLLLTIYNLVSVFSVPVPLSHVCFTYLTKDTYLSGRVVCSVSTSNPPLRLTGSGFLSFTVSSCVSSDGCCAMEVF